MSPTRSRRSCARTSTGRRSPRRRPRRCGVCSRGVSIGTSGGGCATSAKRGSCWTIPPALARGDVERRGRPRAAAARCGDARFPSCSPRSWPAHWPELPSGTSASDPRTPLAGHAIPVHPAGRPGVRRCDASPRGRPVAGRRADGVCGEHAGCISGRCPELDVQAIPGTERLSGGDRSCLFAGRPIDRLLRRRRSDAQENCGHGRCGRDDLPGRRPVRHQLGARRHRLRPGQQGHHAGLAEWRHTGACSCASRTVKRRMARRCCRAGSTCCSRSPPAPPLIDGTKRESSCSR